MAESPKLFLPTAITGWQNIGGVPVTVVNSDRVMSTSGIRSAMTIAPLNGKKTAVVAVKHDVGVMYPSYFPYTQGSCGLVMRNATTKELLVAEVVSVVGGQRWFRVGRYDSGLNLVQEFDLSGQDMSHVLYGERLWISASITGTAPNVGIDITVSGNGTTFSTSVVFVNIADAFTGGVLPTHAGMFLSRTGGPGAHGAALSSIQLK